VAHDVNIGVLPGDEVAVMPDLGGGLDGHEGSGAPSFPG
jgi:hypothetical protein